MTIMNLIDNVHSDLTDHAIWVLQNYGIAAYYDDDMGRIELYDSLDIDDLDIEDKQQLIEELELLH